MFPNLKSPSGPSRLLALPMLLLGFLGLLRPVIAEPMNSHRFTMGIYYPAIANQVSPVDFQAAIDFWLNEFAPTLNLQPATARMFDKMDSLRQAFEAGEIDFILAPPILLVQHIDRQKLADGFLGSSVDGSAYGAILLVRKDAAIERFQQLKGKKLLLVKDDDLGATFLETLSLKNLGQPLSKSFSRIEYKDKQSAVILALFFKQAEIGISDKEMFNVMAELNPQLRQNLEILAEFPTKAANYGFFHSAFPAELRMKISEKLIGLNHETRVQTILNDLHMATLETCSVDELRPFDALIAEYRPLAGDRKK